MMNIGNLEDYIPAQIPKLSQWPELNLYFPLFLTWQLKKIIFPEHDFRKEMSKTLIAYEKYPTLARSSNLK